MIYAVRKQNGRKTLVELASPAALRVDRRCVNPVEDTWVSPSEASKWVLDGKEHETGLWVDDGKVRYARSEKAKAEGEIHSPPGRSAPSIGSTPRIGLTSDGAREPNNETINLG